MELLVFATKTNVVCMLRKRRVYNHSGDDGKEDPPVPIPNTEVKLFNAEDSVSENRKLLIFFLYFFNTNRCFFYLLNRFNHSNIIYGSKIIMITIKYI